MSLQLLTKKKSMVTDHTMLIPDTGSFNDASYNPSPKLKKQNLSQVSSPLLLPNPVIEAYTDTYPAHTRFLDYNQYPDDLIFPSDLSSIRHLSNAAPEGFVKFESTTSEEEKPSAMTPLFKWLGWMCRMIFVGTDEDGDIDAYGVTFVKTD